MIHARTRFAPIVLVLVGAALLNCSSASPSKSGDDMCFPDNDGITGSPMPYTFDITVDDTGFSKTILTTQNEAMVTLTLKNTGTTPHGFKVGCTSVLSSFPDPPAGCPTTACFDASASIAPLQPGASATITFETPTPDNLIYPFTSNEPADSAVPALNNGQWNLI
jgi:hypothetical protein